MKFKCQRIVLKPATEISIQTKAFWPSLLLQVQSVALDKDSFANNVKVLGLLPTSIGNKGALADAVTVGHAVFYLLFSGFRYGI
jgi:hypothetical protein